MIVNKKDLVYCGRGSIYGNPFRIGPDGSREEVIAKHKIYLYNRLETDPEFKKAVLALKGKIKVCFCKPLLCHLDTIEEYLGEKWIGL